jgi:hypothetical protein
MSFIAASIKQIDSFIANLEHIQKLMSLDDLARSDIDLTNWVSRGACGAVGFTRIWRNLTNWPR